MLDRSRIIPLGLAIGLSAAAAHADVPYTGVNLAGAEFGGHTALPGEYGTHYTYPSTAEVDYFIEKGVTTFRVPFKWERLQRELQADFDETEFRRLDELVTYATEQGAYVALDPHNYARYHGEIIGAEGAEVTNEDFADFWARLAEAYKDNERVMFNIVNEPYGMPSTEHWLETANEAIAAIRETGAENLILVPGVAWSGAHSWTADYYGTPNAEVMLGVEDPADNYAFDVHQYLDSDSSGTSEEIVSAEIGAERLVAFTEWAREHGKQGFLGEFAVANSKIGENADGLGAEALDNMLTYMAENSDVWIGWAWWSAGPWWNDYMFTVHPIDFGQETQEDRPVMQVLERHFAGQPAD